MTASLQSRRGLSDGTRVLVALALGIALGGAIAASGNSTALTIADAMQPIGTLWVNAIRMTVIPLVVSLLITGIASVSDLRAVGQLGRRTVIVFLLLLLGSAVVSMLVAPTAFTIYPWETAGPLPLPAGAAQAAGELQASGAATGIVEWLTSLVPGNPVAAAASGNLVSLIVFVFFLALAIARSPADVREPLVRFFKALGDALLLIVHWVIAVAPIGVFALVVPLAARSGGSLIGAVGFYVAVYAVLSALVVVLLYPVVAFWGGISVGRFARAALPAQLIGVSSSSSIATLPAMVESADQMNVPKPVSGFVLPLAVSTFKLAAPVAWMVGVLFVGRFYGVPLGPRELATVGLVSVVLSFAAPGVPRGAFIILTPLFLELGLPPEGIGILIAVDAIPDVCATVVNVTGDLAATALVGNKKGIGDGG